MPESLPDQPSPIALCRYCGEVIYEPVCDHCDHCPAFKAKMAAIPVYDEAGELIEGVPETLRGDLCP